MAEETSAKSIMQKVNAGAALLLEASREGDGMAVQMALKDADDKATGLVFAVSGPVAELYYQALEMARQHIEAEEDADEAQSGTVLHQEEFVL